MISNINNPIFQTIIFSIIILVVIVLTLKKDTNHFFSFELTDELKGFAIFAIICGHIGYFLTSDHQFLYPLSTISGVGVNLFLFLSGYGLTFSQIQKPQNIFSFYKSRIIKIYLPLWFSLILILLIELIFLNIIYPFSEIWQSFLGYFPTANLFGDINSPLWFITYIIIYYLLFPFIFIKKYPLISVFLMFLLSYLLFYFIYPNQFTLLQNFKFISSDVSKLYSLHFLAFPLGMFFALLFMRFKPDKLIFSFLSKIFNHQIILLLRITSLIIIAFLIYHFAIYSGVGGSILTEQLMSLLTVILILLFFLLKNIKIGFFYIFGLFSYEIYLIHWPILFSFNFLYSILPASYATLIYIIIFLSIALLIQTSSKLILKLIGLNR